MIINVSREGREEVLRVLHADTYPNGKVAAIKKAREHSGAGLKESKEWVEAECLMDSPIGRFIWVYSYPAADYAGMSDDDLVEKLLELTEQIHLIHVAMQERK